MRGSLRQAVLTRVTAGAVAAGAALALAVCGSAGADTQTQGHLTKDGSVWLVRGDGHVCKISDSRNLSASTCLNANLVRIENHGFTAGVHGLVNARLYYNQSFQNGGRSAYACISPQSVWKRSPGGVSVHFDQLDPANAQQARLARRRSGEVDQRPVRVTGRRRRSP